MPREPQPPPLSPRRWSIYKLTARQTWVGEVEATNDCDAVEKAAAEFKQ